MSIEITESTVAMWSIDLGHGNWLCHLSRGEGDAHILQYRFRWYRDDKDFDSEDVRHWYRANITGDSASVLRKVCDTFETLRENVPGHRGWELIRGERSVEEFLAALEEMPGIHMRTEQAA